MQESYSVTQDLSYWEYVGLSLSMLPKNKLFKRLLIYVSCLGILRAVLGMLGAGGKEDVGVTSVSTPVDRTGLIDDYDLHRSCPIIWTLYNDLQAGCFEGSDF